MVGEKEVIYNPNAGIERAKLIPKSEVGIIRGAGHLLNYDQPNVVNREIIDFLELD